MKQKRFGELDALRGLAAFAVVIHHYSGHAVRYFHDFPFDFKAGQHGVQLFFCISGFVIFWTLSRSKTLGDFAFSRFTRLYPTYWTALGVSALVGLLLKEPFWGGGYAVNATMLQSFVGVVDLDLVYWTLAVEMAFYAWMAVFYATGQLRRMVWVSCLWLGLSAALAVTARFVAVPVFLNTYLILPHIHYFLAGTMFFLISKEGPRREYVLTICCAWLMAGLIGGIEGLLTAGFVFGVFSLAIGGRLRLLVNPVTVWLGTISYALYLTHRNIGYQMLFALNRRGVPSVLSVAFVTLAALAVASAITYGIEQPAMAWLRGWYADRSAKGADRSAPLDHARVPQRTSPLPKSA